MNPRSASNAWREYLVRQMVVYGDEKSWFLDLYFPENGSSRMATDQLLSAYTRNLETLLSGADKGLCEQALIGSLVTISYLDDSSVETLLLVSPHEAAQHEDIPGVCPISFLSPIGRALLLKHCGEELFVDTPSGKLKLRVESIQQPDGSLLDKEKLA